MTDIQQLDERTVERIAAGEVVERPASVVKELVENAVDADANRVTVAVEGGGTEGIRVTDDGVGMDRESVQRAVEQHTTSKIRDIADLEGGVGTLGFRGEALHAIGAVSRLTITTRPRGGDVGTELVVEGGEVTAVNPAGCPEGTTIAVDDLFYNVPARRKYLKQASTEFAHVNTIATSYALANPDVAVTLEHDGRETFATTGQGDLRETVLSVYGREVAQAMIAVRAGASPGNRRSGEQSDPQSGGDDLPDGPLDGVSGLVSHPETNRAGREYLSTYVNGRYVRAKTAHDAVVDAYGTQIAPDRYPFAVLFLDVPAGDVDVNVHPRKMEVRFADDEGVREQVRTAVEDALLREGLLRSSAPRGRSQPEQTEISPSRSSSADASTSAGQSRGGPDDRSDGATAAGDAVSTPADAGATERDGTTSTAGDTTASGRTAGDDGSTADERAETSGGETGTATPPSDDRSRSTGEAAGGSGTPGGSPTEDVPPARKFSGGHEQARLGEKPETNHETLPSMRVLGQLHETYVVAETDDGLVLIDQHAADERVNYERLQAEFAGETTTQALADPVDLELTAREAAVFEERSDALASLGFHTARTGERTVEVRTLPGVIADAAGPDIVRDVLGAFVGGESEAATTVEEAADELLGDLACYPSVTGNTSLTEGSVRDLLAALDDCDNPYACPHGRPTVIELDRSELEDRFERDYPGHGGRRE
ncbi:DNA mismatch repair endonuclease MutL [Halomicroarcula sp. S1AR25-4]|uniref:DNA mismatch repair endonuclease MutL n=1 Tax=Haloarcula sp. S1AR25-4 TaxID=2950538 RepID=UPI00287715E6|nr:DNA mismatch repair endonuclease MutL [Halomicroarcula sp. S1AR25-4]MDS0277817.1 DNA mismatch repair endonuclease MutL [Halomicroarcula sp. S1AR25-4]